MMMNSRRRGRRVRFDHTRLKPVNGHRYADNGQTDWHAPVDKSNLLDAFPDFHPSLVAVLK